MREEKREKYRIKTRGKHPERPATDEDFARVNRNKCREPLKVVFMMSWP